MGTTQPPESFCCFPVNCENRGYRRRLLANGEAADSAVPQGSNSSRIGVQSSPGLLSSSSQTRHLVRSFLLALPCCRVQ